jgi:hypothetical protein
VTSRLSTLALAVIAGLGLHLLGFVLWEVRLYDDQQREPGRSLVVTTGRNAGVFLEGVIEEQAAFFDSSPLFMPTQWSFARQAGAEVGSLSEATQLYAPFGAGIELPQSYSWGGTDSSPTGDILRPPPLESSLVFSVPPGEVWTGTTVSSPSLTMILESVMSDHPTIRLPLPETIEASLPREPWLSPVVWLQLEQGRLSGLPVIERVPL